MKVFFESMGEKPFRSSQVMQWMYHKKASSFEEMTNLSKSLRENLERHCRLSSLETVHTQFSQDGTRKYLLKLSDGKTIEAVYMPSEDRVTLCISTQVGCRMGCTFCLTAKQGLVRNLSTAEIINQVLEVQKQVPIRISNIVMMGMGEPFDNLDSVIDVIDILHSTWGFNISQRRITVSTVGLVPQILEFGKKTEVNLAISLNASNDETRRTIMPINRKYAIDDLLAACRAFPLKPTRRITFEYVMLEGINNSLNHAQELVQKLQGIRCKINLIPFNNHPLSPYQRPTDESIFAFQKYLIDHHLTATIRYSRGQDILAACGQLVSADFLNRAIKNPSIPSEMGCVSNVPESFTKQ